LALYLLITTASSLLTTLTAEHLFELVENISKRVLPPASSLFELVLKSVEASAEAALERTSRAERPLSTEWILSLFVAGHACLVVDAAFLIV
jgi:hypothetical protein